MANGTLARIRELAAEGLNQSSIAFLIGISHQRVHQLVTKHGIECANTARHQKAVKAKLIEQMKAECTGMTRKEAAAHLGIPPDRLDVYRAVAQFDGIVRAKVVRKRSANANRIIEEAPALAERGLTKSAAARELGIPYVLFVLHTTRHLPNVKWRDGRRGAHPDRRSEHFDLIVEEAPKLAARGFSKTEAARELGVPLGTFDYAASLYHPNLKWRDGRRKAA